MVPGYAFFVAKSCKKSEKEGKKEQKFCMAGVFMVQVHGVE